MANDLPSPSRRRFLQTAGGGFGMLALRALLEQDGLAASAVEEPMAPRLAHYAPKARAVIFLFMYGGPSQVDTFDPKPALEKWANKSIPVFKREDAFNGSTKPTALPSPFRFVRRGRSGLEVTDQLPHLGALADELCVVRSLHCESNNHGPALFQMNTGYTRSGFPSMGSWVTYGLGSEGRNLPSYVVMLDHQGAPVNGALNWTNGFMPAAYQPVLLRTSGEPIANLALPPGVTPEQQRARLTLLRQWNEEYLAENPGESALAARIASYELAYRMQTHAPDAVDLSRETAGTLRAYGVNEKPTHHFGRSCLLARRLVERGVRFVQVYSGGDNGPSAWDAHDDILKNHTLHCAEVDRPIAALLRDLKARGLLETTLVVWGGEFGRLPTHQGARGRDHNPRGFTMWLAGGGIKGGVVHGATDEFGYAAVEKPVSVPDLHATMLHLLGVDHEALTYRYAGRDFRLTDVSGRVVHELLA